MIKGICKKEQFVVTQKPLSFKKVSQAEIMCADFGSMRKLSKVLNDRLMNGNNEKYG